MDLSERLEKIREESGLQQKDFALRLGVSAQTQRNYERGVRRPDTDYLEKLQALGFDVIYLLTGKKNITTLSEEDTKILTLWHQAPEVIKHAALNVLATGQSPQIISHIGNITGSFITTCVSQNIDDSDQENT